MYKDKKNIGNIGETIARCHLESKGYTILHTNYSLPRWGEIDIIAIKDKTIFFVEVKTSKSDLNPLDAINYYKLKHLYRSINYYFNNEGSGYSNIHRIIKVIGIKLDIKNCILKIDDIDIE